MINADTIIKIDVLRAALKWSQAKPTSREADLAWDTFVQTLEKFAQDTYDAGHARGLAEGKTAAYLDVGAQLGRIK